MTRNAPTAGGRPATIDAATLTQLMATAQPPRLVDVRTPGEFETAHIPGSHNVPLDLLRTHLSDLRTHLDDHVVLVCGSGQRAAAAAADLAAAGVASPLVLTGGLGAWQALDAPVRAGRPRWELERQVRLVAGSLVLGSVAASTVIPRAKWVAAGIGTGLTVAALTNTCTMAMLLAKLPYNRGARLDIDGVIATLAGPRP
ncbi:sulfurtransferase [Frankia sp. R43]|uniref:rhodanese-like domain-containing protein n=1 Tax=Frankia sp. R43 TaxID=269536 RepID=UPI0006CA370B|nr:rhodanese-like domain-containing protein [Frankia sp. R43]KPM57338.1 sulfurtransferase [Frankia sp. R43]